MLDIIELCDNMLYVESKRWQCNLGHGEPVKLGLILETVALDEDIHDDRFIVEAHIIPQPECIDPEIADEAMAEKDESRAELIRYAYEVYGGVPLNIDAVQPAKASCGFSSFVAESSIGSLRFSSGDEMEVRRFQDQGEAMRFARDFYAVYASVVFGFIDTVLDNPLRVGGTGWDRIRRMAGR
ncbi:MAG: hypothetical protein A4E48_00437 [Methanosaeta sp. PtaU1.Bin060]|nr:MAG: hypothetical protein A4E48_00437 [Methanosaeta sp. PtaU1.Bin060]